MDTITIVMVAALILKERHGGVSTSLQDAYTRIRDTIISTADAADAARNVLASLEANPTSPARQLALGELLTTIPADQHATLRQLASDLVEQVRLQRHGVRIMQQLYGYLERLSGHVQLDETIATGVAAGQLAETIISVDLLALLPEPLPPPPQHFREANEKDLQALARLYRSPLPDDDITASVERDSATSSPTMSRQQRIAKVATPLLRASLLGGSVVGLIVLWGLIVTPPLSTHAGMMGLVVLSLVLVILSSSLYAVAHVRQQQLEQAEQTLFRQINQDITELLGEQR